MQPISSNNILPSQSQSSVRLAMGFVAAIPGGALGLITSPLIGLTSLAVNTSHPRVITVTATSLVSALGMYGLSKLAIHSRRNDPRLAGNAVSYAPRILALGAAVGGAAAGTLFSAGL